MFTKTHIIYELCIVNLAYYTFEIIFTTFFEEISLAVRIMANIACIYFLFNILFYSFFVALMFSCTNKQRTFKAYKRNELSCREIVLELYLKTV